MPRTFGFGSLVFVLLSACASPLPPRYVIEQDIATYQYRRYQQLLDIELQVEDNPAVAHAATYVRAGELIELIPAVVTRYTHAEGLADTLRQRLRTLDGYTLTATTLSGAHVWRFQGAEGDTWWLWLSGAHFIKLGAAEGTDALPEHIAGAYLKLYPSSLTASSTGAKAAP